MTKGWRVIDCTAMTGKLTYKRGQLVVEHHDSETRIPLADTAVLLLGVQTTVSTVLLQQLAVFRRGSTHMPVERNPNSRIATMEQTKHPFRRPSERTTGNEHSREKSSMAENRTRENTRPIPRTRQTRLRRRGTLKKFSSPSSFRRPEQHRGTSRTGILAPHVPRGKLPSIPRIRRR